MLLVRSDDGGETFSSPVEVAGDEDEGVVTSRDMATLLAAPGGDVYVSFLDGREKIAEAMQGEPEEGHGGHGGHDPDAPQTHLRVIRSSDQGRTWATSSLVARATCVCCGTVVAKGEDGPVYAGTRSEWYELEGSTDPVRDPYLATSPDDGETWSEPFKIHDDGFKVSGCPDVAQGLAVDSTGRLHAAWYTGTESHPGIFYATSDDGGRTFSAPSALLEGDWVPYSDVRLAVDGQDHAWVAFEDRRGDVDKIGVVRLTPDGKASFSQTWEGTIPSISAGRDFATVVWQEVPGPDEDEDALSSVHAVVARSG
ncbi:MAG: sialidase family protein [Acidimicrobiia bacterium]